MSKISRAWDAVSSRFDRAAPSPQSEKMPSESESESPFVIRKGSRLFFKGSELQFASLNSPE
jgi:hypothetical protein